MLDLKVVHYIASPVRDLSLKFSLCAPGQLEWIDVEDNDACGARPRLSDGIINKERAVLG